MLPAAKSHTVSRGLSTVRDREYTDSLNFLKRFFGDAEGQIDLRRLPNNRGSGANNIFSRDDAAIHSFLKKGDTDGFGCYFGVCTRRKGAASGAKENCVEAVAIWVDIDALKEQIPGETVLSTLAYLPHPPSIVVNSGGGIHAYWMLEEPVDVSTEKGRDAIEEANRRLAMVLAGDLQCAEVARIMRIPGTHNSKDRTKAVYDGLPALCEVIEDNGGVHDLETLSDWLAEQRVLLKGTIIKKERRQEVDDPYLTHAKANGYQPPIDIDAELDAMEHEGNGSVSIHETQLRVTASMVARGYETEEIVSLVLAATERAAPPNANWNWRREEKAIRGMIDGARKKSFDAPKPERPASTPAIPQSSGNTAVAVVHDLDAERKKRRDKADEDKRDSKMLAVAKATLAVWQDRYGPILHTGGTSYAYSGGVWREFGDAEIQMMRSMIQAACRSLNVMPNTSNLNGAYRWIMENDELTRDDVEFDAHGLIIADDAALDADTGQVVKHSPEHYALYKVEARIGGYADDRHPPCPAWLSFLRESLSDKQDRDACISTLQEWFGAALVTGKLRKQRGFLKGMLVHGASRSGKTQVAQVMRALLGIRHCSGAKARDLEGKFGMEPFLGKRGWIADDAVGEGEYLDAETYKVVVTGEVVGVNRKGRGNVDVSFGFPVMLTANNLPRVRDQSSAVFNRSLILPMNVVRPETAPEPKGYESISAKIAAEELSGVFWWAYEGWKRLSNRGYFDPPASMSSALHAFESENNPIGTWFSTCVELKPFLKVARQDLLASFNGWLMQEYGQDTKWWGGRSFHPRLMSKLPAHKEPIVMGERFVAGVALNEEGIQAREKAKSSKFGSTIGSDRDEYSVNQSYAGDAPKEAASAPGKPRF